jgi:superfamily I DNA/RNA helicase
VSVLKAKGLLEHGAKTLVDDWAGQEEGSGVPTILDNDHIHQVFEAEALNALYEMLALRENAEESATLEKLLAWWSSRLPPAKAKASHYPLAVAAQKGVGALCEPPKLFVGSIHSMKGAEADVTIIFPDLSPAGYREWLRPGEARDGVVRLLYVAITRARETVILCEPSSDQAANLLPLLN